MFIGFVIALGFKYLYPNHWHRFNAHQRLVWRRGIFILFSYFCDGQLKEAGFKLSVFLGAAGILTVALGFASQTSAIT
jgi:small-conductance mechanosensitive channel